MATPPEQTNPAKPANASNPENASRPKRASNPAKGPQQSKPSRTTRIRRAYRKLPQPLKIVLGCLGTLLMIGLFILGIRLVMLLLVVLLEIPWVASGVLLGLFLILLFPSNGWTNFGAYLFLIGAAVSAFLYRLSLYSVIYGVLITLRGFLPKMKTTTSAS